MPEMLNHLFDGENWFWRPFESMKRLLEQFSWQPHTNLKALRHWRHRSPAAGVNQAPKSSQGYVRGNHLGRCKQLRNIGFYNASKFGRRRRPSLYFLHLCFNFGGHEIFEVGILIFWSASLVAAAPGNLPELFTSAYNNNCHVYKSYALSLPRRWK